MADIANKLPENVPGKYYVDSDCAYCGTCVELAPENFAEADEYSYVKKQPENSEEEENCQEALASCPSEAIGDDGE